MATINQNPNRGGTQVARTNDPFDQLFESMLPAFFRPVRMNELMGEGGGRLPHLDIIDREHDVIIKADAAGISKENLDIQVHGNTLYLSGHREDESDKEEGKYLYRERRFGGFSRTVQLPVEVDSNKAKASFKDGILELVLPKAESAKRRKIEIQ